ncbi:MarR family winged helix-turn-helix transcriptional regulator [Solirubrobacter ginsenosidimutans]|uniref:MarR family winged helix-turn-helix transcriptional regulator n=1 Tax=Solirubrobacter ginsenosidimutans TaxID=490573 RepID=A0A9X3MRD8_9ACTN|nr:MarR family winged helix-turn-helix transcriptional regulator [Solirubrobacter ginsenosidimutans]MDA0159785.1 MarR family winged helix-turn-helix transcriptional regulator [Solirubrobacter ginsenosidimutans]
MDGDSKAKIHRSLAALELAAVRYRGGVRRRLNVGDEELTALLYLAHHGGVAQRRLAEITTLSRSGAGAMIQRLEHDGFVERHTDPADRRLRVVHLSTAGRNRVHDAYRDFGDATDRVLAATDPADVERLAGLLGGLAAAAETTHAVDPPLAPAARDPIWRRWS